MNKDVLIRQVSSWIQKTGLTWRSSDRKCTIQNLVLSFQLSKFCDSKLAMNGNNIIIECLVSICACTAGYFIP